MDGPLHRGTMRVEQHAVLTGHREWERLPGCLVQACQAARSFSSMSAKRAFRIIRENPLFPFIPFGPGALFVGSVVMSALALRGVRQLRRELAAAS